MAYRNLPAKLSVEPSAHLFQYRTTGLSLVAHYFCNAVQVHLRYFHRRCLGFSLDQLRDRFTPLGHVTGTIARVSISTAGQAGEGADAL